MISSSSYDFFHYPCAPFLYDAKKALREEILVFKGKNVIFKPPPKDCEILKFREKVIKPAHQYSSLSAEMEGLNEALESAEGGMGLRKFFNPHWQQFREARERGLEREYGSYVFYPAGEDLVQYAPRELHRLTLVTSNATLYQDPQMKMGWEGVRKIFDSLVVAVAGGSVGNNIARLICKDIRPNCIKIADQRPYKWANANRVELFYDDLVWHEGLTGSAFAPSSLKNKAIATAAQIHKTDPFISIWAYYQGIHAEFVNTFICGSKVEPEADIVIDEMDSLEMKFLIAEECRRNRKIFIRGTDAGSAAQIDILRFDKSPGLPLAAGVSDQELYRAFEKYRNDKNRKNFFRVAELLLGPQHKKGEFKNLIDDKEPNMFTSIPQLGSTAALTAALVCEVVARIALGFSYPQRFIFDKKNLKSEILFNEQGIRI